MKLPAPVPFTFALRYGSLGLLALRLLLLPPAPGFAQIPEAVHPDFDLREIKLPTRYKTMGLDFFKDGTLVLGTSEVIGGGEVPIADAANKVFLIKGISTDSQPALIKEVASGWKQIAGVTVAGNRLFVSDRDGFYEIPELSAPAEPGLNRRQVMKWPDENRWNNGPYWHQWAFTPMHQDGFFYAPYSGSIAPGGWSNVDPTSKFSGAFLKWDSTGKLEAYAGGLRSPNGANADPFTGEFFATDNQGSWVPASTFLRIRPGRFYGHRQSSPDLDSAGNVLGTNEANFAEGLEYDRPVAWLPHGWVRSSPSQPVALTQGRFAGDWILGDVNHAGLVRISLDRVGEAINGAVFWFSEGTGTAAIHRMARGPDGSIVIGTLTHIGGNWPGGDKSPMFRLSAKPEPAAFDLKSVKALADGLELEFTQPVNPDSIGTAHFQVKSWQYLRQKEYGVGRQPEETRAVIAAEASRDRKRVHLALAGMAEDRVLHVKITGVVSSGGKGLWNNEAWFTLNAIPARAWDGEKSTALAAPRLPGWTVSAEARNGGLTVAFACAAAPGACGGAVDVSLFSPAGTRLFRASGRVGPGSAPIRFARPGAGPGVYLLRAEAVPASGGAQGNVSVTRRVCF
jgi:hypothetical protein